MVKSSLGAGAVPRDAAILETQEWLSETLHRPPGRWLARKLVNTRLTPIHVTVMAGIAGVLAGILLIAGAHHPALRVAGGIALIVSCMLDCADGELARARKRYSLIGMMLDGLTDNIVGAAAFVAMAYNIVVYTGNDWMWLLGVVAGVSAGAHAWIYDAKKKQFRNCVGVVQPEEVQPISSLRAQQAEARAQGHRFEAFLLGAYIFFRQTQSLGVRAAAAPDPVRFWNANRRRMRLWTLMGSSLHFFILYVSAIISPLWPASFVACALTYAVVLNLFFVWMLTDPWDTDPA